METEASFLLAHISDLHFSDGTDRSNKNLAHSIEHLIGLEKSLAKLNAVDLLIVSGDISNHGDRQSLITASGWLFSSIPIGNGEYTGLKLSPNMTGVVPGNHDAWNASSSGTLIDRRQHSLENYNFAFPDHKVSNTGCSFQWIEKNGAALYIAFVDSCFLGDTEENIDSTFGTQRIDQIAKGKLTVAQTEQLLEWNDQGTQGVLEIPHSLGNYVSKEAFAKSLKILVMHHYLFEPPERKSDYFMQLQHRDIVFRNIALSDFDILLCGHKHVPSFDIHDYGTHFDRRAVHRYMLNYFRRLIGLESLPIQLVDEKGRRFSKPLSLMIELIGGWMKRFGETFNDKKVHLDDSEIAERVFDLLKQGLESPDDLRRKVERFLHEMGTTGATTLDSDELKRIQKRISTGLSIQDRKSLRRVADQVSEISKKLKERAFLQIMSGSSAKVPSNTEKKRSFQTYRITRTAESWKIESQRYDWDKGTFDSRTQVRTHVFTDKT